MIVQLNKIIVRSIFIDYNNYLILISFIYQTILFEFIFVFYLVFIKSYIFFYCYFKYVFLLEIGIIHSNNFDVLITTNLLIIDYFFILKINYLFF